MEVFSYRKGRVSLWGGYLAREGPVLCSLAVTHMPSSVLHGTHSKGMEDRKQFSSDLELKWHQVDSLLANF